MMPEERAVCSVSSDRPVRYHDDRTWRLIPGLSGLLRTFHNPGRKGQEGGCDERRRRGVRQGELPNRGACRRAVRQENCQTAGHAGGLSGRRTAKPRGLQEGSQARRTAKPRGLQEGSRAGKMPTLRGLQERGRVEKFRCSDKMTEEDGVTSHTINPNPVAGSTPVSV